MKKLIFCILAVLFLGLCWFASSYNPNNRELLGIDTIYYSKLDSENIRHGYYKRIVWNYNYEYHGKFITMQRIDAKHGLDIFINEYRDTVEKIYVDYTNYPRRKED